MTNTRSTTKRTTSSTRAKATKVDHDALIEVMNGASGKLIYQNKRTGAQWEFNEYGAVELMPVQELITMRSQQPRFFRDQWLVVLDAEVINYLRLDQFYKGVMTPDELEAFFEKDTDEIEAYLKTASNGAKSLIAGRARKMYEDGSLSDIFKLRAINQALGIHIADVE